MRGRHDLVEADRRGEGFQLLPIEIPLQPPPRLAGPPSDGAPVAPGMLPSHYAPRAAVRLHAVRLEVGEAGLDFGRRFAGPGRPAGQGTRMILDLSPRRDLAEAAANLFGHLRLLDDALGGAGRIAAAPVTTEGLGEAIIDRLGRAAANR